MLSLSLVNNCNEAVVKNQPIMKIVFRDEQGDDLFIVTEKQSKHFILPRVDEDVIWMKLFLTVKSITHNYDSSQIEIDCEVT